MYIDDRLIILSHTFNNSFMKKIKGLHFQPWIGPNWEKSKYGKLLLLGESHYLNGDKDTSNLTTLVVKEAVSEKKGMNTAFFWTTELIFGCKEPGQLWNNVAYANLIQNGLPKAQSQPQQKDRATINPSFKLLLDNLKPKKVIVLSKRMWTIWLTEESGKCISFINVNDKKSEVWEYEYDKGKLFSNWYLSSLKNMGKFIQRLVTNVE